MLYEDKEEEVENIDIKNKEAYLNGVLIDHCYYGQKYSLGSTYFYAKKRK